MQRANLIKLILPIIILPATLPERSNGAVRPNHIKTAFKTNSMQAILRERHADFMDGFENFFPNPL